jgi:hypothetical protein
VACFAAFSKQHTDELRLARLSGSCRNGPATHGFHLSLRASNGQVDLLGDHVSRRLPLIDERRFGSGVVHLHYRISPPEKEDVT